MTTLLISHDVDDVERWLASPKREEYFGPGVRPDTLHITTAS